MNKISSINIPTWLMQVLAGLMLGSILTGVIALNIRFSRLEKADAIQEEKIKSMEENYSKREWVIENFEAKKK